MYLFVPLVYHLSDNYRFVYKYEVAKSVNNVMQEQRRLIHPRCLRSIYSDVLIPETSSNFAFNMFDMIGGIVGIPIPHEMLTQVADNLQGLANFYVNETITNYIELNTAKYLMAFREDNYKFETLEVNSIEVANKKINLKNQVIKSFPKQVTKIYPVLLSKIEQLSVSGKVGDYVVVSIIAHEVFVE